jgi:RTX calcium-binding nonapeptide repeat (4 copies)
MRWHCALDGNPHIGRHAERTGGSNAAVRCHDSLRTARAGPRHSGTDKDLLGTAGNDDLRGTRGADVISGKAGNDTIRGLAGNDRLVGGKGNDRLYGNAGRDSYSCGAGNDIVFADTVETTGADCEDVRRPAPPPEPEPPPLSAPTGRYVFVTSQGNAGTLMVELNGQSFTRLVFPYRTICQPSGNPAASALTLRDGVVVALGRDLSFSLSGTGQTDDGGSFTATIEGRFQSTGDLSGTARIQDSGDSNGTHYECDSGVITFTGQPSP